jgi:antirestriction protein
MAEERRILVWHAKEGDVYYEATTLEDWAKACLAVATDLSEWGVYEEWDLQEVEDVDVSSIPEAYRAGVVAAKAQSERCHAETMAYNESAASIRKAVAEKSVALKTWRTLGGGTRVEPALWGLLRARSDGVYEGVSLETLRET